MRKILIPIFSMLSLLVSGCHLAQHYKKSDTESLSNITSSETKSNSETSDTSSVSEVISSENISSEPEHSSSSESSIEESSSVEERKYKTINAYQNPLKFYKQNGEQYNLLASDPDVIKCEEDGYFYLYPTGGINVYDLSDTYYLDYGPIFRSKDLINWTYVGSVFRNQEQYTEWGTSGAGVWAPSVLKVGDTYNYYYSLSTLNDSNPGIGVATSPTPYGPWTHYGKLFDSVNTGVENSIDPQAIYYEDELYVVWGSFKGIACIQLYDDGTETYYPEVDGHIDGVRYLIPDNSEGRSVGENLDYGYEGSYIIKRNGYYYYTGSQGVFLNESNPSATSYRVKAGKSSSFFGFADGNSYVNKNSKSLEDRAGGCGELVIHTGNNIAGPGHHTFVEDFGGNWWMIYHGVDYTNPDPEVCKTRTLFMDKVLWDEQGYPYIDNYVPTVRVDQYGPTVVDFDN